MINNVLIRPIINQTPYELYKGKKYNIYHLHVFRYKCFILNNMKDNLEKFDAKTYECLFLGYSTSSKTFRIFNKRTLTIEESVHVTFDDSNPKSIEVKVVYCTGILEKKSLEDKEQDIY